MESDKRLHAREIDELFRELIEDVQAANQAWADNPCPFTKRTYIRTVFAFVEGMIQVMKHSCLHMQDSRGVNIFSPEEMVFLREEQTYLKENGTISTKNAKISLAPNLRFTISCVNKTFPDTRPLDTGGDGWRSFTEAIAIRNRITHPSSPNELAIQDEDMEVINHAMDFFRTETIPFVQANKI